MRTRRKRRVQTHIASSTRYNTLTAQFRMLPCQQRSERATWPPRSSTVACKESRSRAGTSHRKLPWPRHLISLYGQFMLRSAQPNLEPRRTADGAGSREHGGVYHVHEPHSQRTAHTTGMLSRLYVFSSATARRQLALQGRVQQTQTQHEAVLERESESTYSTVVLP